MNYFDPAKSRIVMNVQLSDGSKHPRYSRTADNDKPDSEIISNLIAQVLRKMTSVSVAFFNYNENATGRKNLIATCDAAGNVKYR